MVRLHCAQLVEFEPAKHVVMNVQLRHSIKIGSRAQSASLTNIEARAHASTDACFIAFR